MWRSDPQIAVVVMRTIASRGFRIVGSGTSSTRTSSFPYQQSASISPPVWLPVDRRQLARFHLALEPAQIFAHLNVGLFAKQLGDRRARSAEWRIVGEPHVHLGPTVRRRLLESHRAGIRHRRVRPRPPTAPLS